MRQIVKGDEPMKKWALIVAIILLAACTEKEPLNEPTRLQLEKINAPDEIEIFDEFEVDFIASELERIKWEPNVQPEMARIEDVMLRLFIMQDPNMPEYIITYRIWIEHDKSLTLLSTDKKQGYGRLEANKAEELVAFLYDKIALLQPVINRHGHIENRAGFEHFLTQVQDKKPETVNIIHYTIEGDPIYYRVDYDSKNFKLEIDNREDKFGQPELKTYACDSLQYVHNGELTFYKLTLCDSVEGDLEIMAMPFDSENQKFTKDYLPEMTLTIGQRSLSVNRGTYAWTLPTTKLLESMQIQADHASPNQMLQLSNAVKVEKSAPVKIQFEIEPTRVEYRVWNQETMLGTFDSIEAIDLTEPFILEVFAYFGDSFATYVTALQFQ